MCLKDWKLVYANPFLPIPQLHGPNLFAESVTLNTCIAHKKRYVQELKY